MAQIPQEKPKFRGSARNFAGKLWALYISIGIEVKANNENYYISYHLANGHLCALSGEEFQKDTTQMFKICNMQ